MHTAELQDITYRCLEDCGFCCTFTPEASAPELAALKAKFPQLPVVRDGDVARLGFQGGCGACTLLKDRRCSSYDLRPAHCRYFPFHVYFGRRMEVCVNRSCRGVERRPGATLQAEFQAQVLDLVPMFRMNKEQQKADAVHASFERNARQSKAWGDVDAEAATLLAHGAAWFDPRRWPSQAGSTQEAGSPEEAFAVAFAPFQEPDPVARPYHLDDKLRWLGLRGGPDGVFVDTLDEQGNLKPLANLGPMRDWPALPPSVQDGLAGVLRRLCARDSFAGSVFHLVDDVDYAIRVSDAARIRIGDMAADLAIRAEIMRRLGVPEARVVEETERCYDSAFLDAPTIGGWL